MMTSTQNRLREQVTQRIICKPARCAGLGGVLAKVKQYFCAHSFALDDLTMVNRESEGSDRVSWACDKCGKVFRAQCGLDISPEHGPIFRRRTTPNAEVSGPSTRPPG